jgi:hypothetical protein
MKQSLHTNPLTMLLLLFTLLTLCSASPERNFNIINESGRRVELHWVHPETGEMVLQSTPDILAGATFALNSYVGHTFQVRELPGKKSGVCEGDGEVCRIDMFTVNSNSDQGEFRLGVLVAFVVGVYCNCDHCSCVNCHSLITFHGY